MHAQEPQEKTASTVANAGRWLILCAFLAPALVAAGSRLKEISGGAGAPPAASIGLAAALIWIVAACLRPLRPALVEVGVVLISRLSFVVFLLVAFFAALLSTADTGGTSALMISPAALLLALAGGIRAWRADRRRLGFELIVLGFYVLLVALLDVLVGAFVIPERSHNNVFVVHDPVLGWKLRPDFSVQRGRDGGDPVIESTNRLGFRSRDWPEEKPEGVLRIVILGDSHTEAYEVGDGETWPELLQQALSEDRPVEVIPFGVGGWSTDQQLLAYLQYGRRFSPDIVVLQMASNDIAFNALDEYWRGRKPWFRRHGEVLMLQGVPTPNFRNTGLFADDLLGRSNILLLVEAVLRQQAIERAVLEEADMEEAWRVTELLLRDLDSVVASDGARLLVLMADARHEYEARIKAMLERQDIPYLETRDAYPGDFDSYWSNGHWNSSGQHAVVDRLVPGLRGYLPAAN